jgi:hypothetical protein
MEHSLTSVQLNIINGITYFRFFYSIFFQYLKLGIVKLQSKGNRFYNQVVYNEP